MSITDTEMEEDGYFPLAGRKRKWYNSYKKHQKEVKYELFRTG
jgi:hypothetical protein